MGTTITRQEIQVYCNQEGAELVRVKPYSDGFDKFSIIPANVSYSELHDLHLAICKVLQDYETPDEIQPGDPVTT